MTAKKSLYVFLCAIMGVLLFLILHQILAFGYLMLLYGNYQVFSLNLSFMDLMALDYFTLIIVLILGAWYGIWLGLHWYEMVYEGDGYGFVEHVVKHYWPVGFKSYSLKAKISTLAGKLEGDLMELENLAEKPIGQKKPVVRKRIVRRKV